MGHRPWRTDLFPDWKTAQRLHRIAGGFLQRTIWCLSLGLLFNLGAAGFKSAAQKNRLWRIFFEA